MRKSIEFGTIVGGNKGFFIDYATSASAKKVLKIFANDGEGDNFSCVL
jgi:hypothetical protein